MKVHRDTDRREQLDGLRFLLFLMVFAVHYVPNPLEYDYLGYALPAFFVMSGFVVTHVLVAADHLPLAEKLRIFYLRRMLRVLPAYFLVLALLIGLGAVAYPGWYAAFLANMKLYTLSLDPASHEMREWLAGDWRNHNWHLWSLSVEEQFYVLFPLVLYLTPRHRRTLVLAGIIAGSIAFHVFAKRVAPQAYYGALLPVCMEYLGWGCLLAWLHAQRKLARLCPQRTLVVSAATMVAVIALQHWHGSTGLLQFQTTLYQTLIAPALAFVIWALWALPPSHAAVRFLSLRPLVYLGSMTYVCYLVHLIALDLFRATGIVLPLGPVLGEAVGALAVTLGLSAVIWHLYDKPIQQLRAVLPGFRVRRTGHAAA